MRSRDEIRVGVSLSLSGEFQLQGQDALRGVRLWVDYVERDGGIALGHSGSRRSPQLIVDDDGGKTERAKDNVLRLLTKDGVNLEGPHDPRLRPFLGEISSEEAHAGRGMLTALVVHKHGDYQPGPGFFELARSLGHDTSDVEKFLDSRGEEGLRGMGVALQHPDATPNRQLDHTRGYPGCPSGACGPWLLSASASCAPR